MKLLNSTEDLTAPIAGQANNSIAKITAGFVVLLPFLYLAFLYLANLLPPADAERAKNFASDVLPQLATIGGGGGALALFVRSLLLTQGKIKAQTPPAMPETVNAAGDVTVGGGLVPTGTAAYHGSEGGWVENLADLDTPDAIQRAAVIEQEREAQNGEL